jgi:CheY-like chemotaxis protein
VERSRLAPDLLITDIMMPGISGPALAARLMQKNPRLRVLYVSGYSDESGTSQSPFAGEVQLLHKPFTPSALAERIRTILDTSR